MTPLFGERLISTHEAGMIVENAKDTVSDFYLKDPTDPQWKDDQGYKDWLVFMDKYYPEGDKTDGSNVYAPSVAQTLVQVLKQMRRQSDPGECH